MPTQARATATALKNTARNANVCSRWMPRPICWRCVLTFATGRAGSTSATARRTDDDDLCHLQGTHFFRDIAKRRQVFALHVAAMPVVVAALVAAVVDRGKELRPSREVIGKVLVHARHGSGRTGRLL